MWNIILYFYYLLVGWKNKFLGNGDGLDGKQAYIVREILDSEKRYVQSLGIITDVFLKPLNESLESEEPILKEKEIRAIFSYAEVIGNLNENFYKDLQKATAEKNPIHSIGKLFCDHSQFFKMYSTFINGYNVSLSTLCKCKDNNEEFSNFLDEAEDNPLCNKLDLASYLIMLVQRLPRYVLLLKELMANTPPKHPGFVKLQEGFKKMLAVADQINDSKRTAENAQQVFEIHESVVGNTKSIVVPHRLFHSEDDVHLRIAKDKTQKSHYFLFNDSILLVTKAGPGLTKDKKWKFYSQLDLDKVEVTNVENTKESKNALYLSSQKSKHFVILQTAEKKESLMDVITTLKSHPTNLPPIPPKEEVKPSNIRVVVVGVVGVLVVVAAGLAAKFGENIVHFK